MPPSREAKPREELTLRKRGHSKVGKSEASADGSRTARRRRPVDPSSPTEMPASTSEAEGEGDMAARPWSLLEDSPRPARRVVTLSEGRDNRGSSPANESHAEHEHRQRHTHVACTTHGAGVFQILTLRRLYLNSLQNLEFSI